MRRIKLQPQNVKILVLGLIVTTTVLFIALGTIPGQIATKQVYFLFHPDETIACYRLKAPSLPDISNSKPRKGKSIFFHETSCASHQLGKIYIFPRQACAVESAAKMNPNFDVYLLYTSPGIIKNEGTPSDRIIKALQSYENIHFHHVDYEKYANASPVEDLYRNRRLEFSMYPRSHASDILRYLTLWRYGGIYLDLDVVVIKSLEDLPPNYAGSESAEFVAAGVMSFASTGIGNYYAKSCLNDLKQNFNGNDWGNNGPGVITRLLRRICSAHDAKNMLNKDCHGFTVYPPEAFYPVPWWNWTMYFGESYNKQVLKMAQNSYAIHVWNKHSIETKVSVNTDVPYSIFARKYCPKVFAECDEYF